MRWRISSTSSAPLRPVPTRAISLRVMAWKLKLLPASLAKNFGGVMLAVDTMCATTSRTVQPVHRDGLSQSASESFPSASTSDERSILIICQVSMTPPIRDPSRLL